MLYGLVTVSVVAHIHDLHLPDFVDDTAIIAFVEHRRQHKHGIHHLVEGILASHQVNESLRIMENRPRIVPAVSFRKGITPLQGIERRLECAVLILAAHQLVVRIEKIPVVQRTFGKRSQFFLRLAQRKSQL